ncbi:uncharacterized protein LOC131957371 [Physella acuta]|uniref:uncharacterized protein LOC131957371 n=1 Tax=Physella acuta TaxID=109671 RepID=UPI0027DE54CB|nr:uncharacterized protein LOC131957371 [Physella acuta]
MLGVIIQHPTPGPPQPTSAPKDERKLQHNNSNIKQAIPDNKNTSPPFNSAKFYRKSSHIGRSRSVSVSGQARAGDVVYLPRVKKKQPADKTPEEAGVRAAPEEYKAGILNLIWRKMTWLFVAEPVVSSPCDSQRTKARTDAGVRSTSAATRGRHKSPAHSPGKQRPKPPAKRSFLLAPIGNQRLSPVRGAGNQPAGKLGSPRSGRPGKLGSPRSGRPGKIGSPRSGKKPDQRLERSRKYEWTLSEVKGQGKETSRSSKSPLRPPRAADARRAVSLPSVRSWQEDEQAQARLAPMRVRSEFKKKTRERGDDPATRPRQLARKPLNRGGKKRKISEVNFSSYKVSILQSRRANSQLGEPQKKPAVSGCRVPSKRTQS